MGRTVEEQKLLALLANGELDGLVGDDFYTNGGSTIWTVIKGGIPVRYKQGPRSKFFDGKENEYYSGVLHTLQEWITDDQKLAFLQQFGWLMDNHEVRAYSAKFKPQK